MRAITIPVPVDPRRSLGRGARPEPGAGEVIIDVAASAVNRADLLAAAGALPAAAGRAAVPRVWNAPGVIGAVGPGVTGWAVGEQVCALLAGGGYAERVAVPAGQLLPVPAGVDLVDAAALPEVACTVWSNVVRRGPPAARARPCWSTAAAAGSARSRCSSARRSARPCVATARAGKHDALRELGADATIDYTERGLRRGDPAGHRRARRRRDPRHHGRRPIWPGTSRRWPPAAGW